MLQASHRSLFDVVTTMIVYCVLSIIILILLIFIYNDKTRGVCRSSAHLVNKVVIVTGANSGIGFEIAKDMAERGARVIIACRSEQRALNALNKIKETSINADVHYRHLDLASFTSIRKFAAEIIESEKRLDILVNNVGIIVGANEITEDGLSVLYQTNFLGPFLLTSLLVPLLKLTAPSRIIFLSSIAHYFVLKFDANKLGNISRSGHFLANTYSYMESKLCINLMTFELARRLQNTGVTVNCLHPGVVRTNILEFIDFALVRYPMKLLIPFFKNVWDGAQTAIYLGVAPDLINSSGGYYTECKLANTSKLSQNLELAQNVWQVSENLVNPCRNRQSKIINC